MNEATAILSLAQNAMEVALYLSAPLLLTALVVGLLISILQAATQINESTLSFVPKLVAIFLAIALAGPWMLGLITSYIQRLFESIPQVIS